MFMTESFSRLLKIRFFITFSKKEMIWFPQELQQIPIS